MKRNRKSLRKLQAQGSSRKRSRTRRSVQAPKDATGFFARSERFQDLWNKVVGVVSRMRAEKISLLKASQDGGVSPSSVKRWGRSALRKDTRGRWVARKSDRLLRVMALPTPQGMGEIAIRDSRQATLLATYLNAVHRYLESGDRSRLEQFQGKYVADANGVRVPLLTDLHELKRLGAAGDLTLESIYRKG
jgi:hypothetical protein